MSTRNAVKHVVTIMLRFPQMPTEHILDLLIAERDKLTRAIEVLQGTPRRGTQRTSAMPAIDSIATPNHARKRRWSAAKRRAASARAKAVWVRRRKEAAKRS
jgi:hypothetical protein